MQYKTGNRVGLALLMGAIAIRILAQTGTDVLALRTSPKPFDLSSFTALTMSMATGTPLPQPVVQEPRVWVLKILHRKEQLPEPEPEPIPMTFSAEEAHDISIGGASSYAVDKPALLTAPLTFENTESPSVLILHTHTSEAYTQTAGWTYTETDPLRTTENAHNVVAVGTKIAETLEARGISVVHDTAYHDYPDYNSAYSNAKTATEQWLEQYPSIQVVLDIHRDAIEDADGNPLRETVTLSDGTQAAKLMLVVGTDQGGLHHPQWRDNLSLAMKVQAAVTRSAPKLCKAMDLRTERFNQHLSPGALLVEVGSTGNTLPEALASAEILARNLADVLVGEAP